MLLVLAAVIGAAASSGRGATPLMIVGVAEGPTSVPLDLIQDRELALVGNLMYVREDFLAATRAIASRCASTAMIFLMHVCAAQVTLAGKGDDADELRAMADGSNLSTLAFSERGSRSHFWAPVSQLAGSRLSAQKSFVTSAGHADG